MLEGGKQKASFVVFPADEVYLDVTNAQVRKEENGESNIILRKKNFRKRTEGGWDANGIG